MTQLTKNIIRGAAVLLIILLGLGAYYLYSQKGSEDEVTDPLYCERDVDCGHYYLLNCIHTKPINKEYKKRVLHIGSQEDSLCGDIKTSCENNECTILK